MRCNWAAKTGSYFMHGPKSGQGHKYSLAPAERAAQKPQEKSALVFESHSPLPCGSLKLALTGFIATNTRILEWIMD